MKTASWKKAPQLLIVAALVATGAVVAAAPADAGVRVWADSGWDIYPSYHDVVISVRADRTTYATLFVVDTDGYLHVLRPFVSPRRARLRAGRVYRYTAAELGLHRLHGRGVAYIFAVGSPRPFDYSRWDQGLHVGHYGYRVSGDPFLACRELVRTILPARCDRSLVTITSARFYIGEWSRYPSYLCEVRAGLHVRMGDVCRECSHTYDRYRRHAGSPAHVFDGRWIDDDERRPRVVRRTTVAERESARRAGKGVTARVTRRTRVVSSSRVVESSRSKVVKHKRKTFAKKQGASQRVAKTSAKPTSKSRTSRYKKTSVKRTKGGVGSGSANKTR